MWTLGVNHALHESSACVVNDGEVFFATAEERLSRIKQDSGFPHRAIGAALAAARIEPSDLSAVGFSFPRPEVGVLHDLSALLTGRVPRTRWWAVSPIQQLLDPNGNRSDRRRLSEILGDHRGRSTHFFGHHLSHAWSAVAMAPTECDAVLVADGRGARNSTTIWVRDGRALRCIEAKRFPNSLGLFYARITQYLGFQPLADEWKVMGLAAYGRPTLCMDSFITVGADDYWVNARRLLGAGFNDLKGLEELLGPARRPDDDITEHHHAIAASAQQAIELAMLAMTRRVVRLSGAKRMALAGGVAMNVKANGQILRSGLLDDLVIQPAASDEGSAVGAALAAQMAAGGPPVTRSFARADLGQSVDDSEVASVLSTYKLGACRVDDAATTAADMLAGGMIIGWFQGRTEFGPRALGHRSILADPRDAAARDRVNAAVKFREAWRPFAPSVLEECASQWFEGCNLSPYMIVSFPVREEIAARIPAVVHVDGTARVHTVSQAVDPLYWKLIRSFGDRTGIPLVLNTSFNLKGAPIVNTVKDAIETFFTSGLDALVIGRWVLRKGGRPVEEPSQ